MSKTRTGGYAIGIRRLNSNWQADIWDVVQWAKVNDFDAVDLRNGDDNDVHTVAGAGLRVGSIDLADWQGMICSDKGRRAEAIERNRDHIRNCADIGPVNHFVVMLPEDPGLPRHDNFRYMIDSYGELATVLMKIGARVVIEGWPGPGALCCTPEGYRSLFRECPSLTIGINYDLSHLLRIGHRPVAIPRRVRRPCVPHARQGHGTAAGRHLRIRELPGPNLWQAGSLWRHALALYDSRARPDAVGRSLSHA